jgi:hypothetical protein
MIIVQILGGLGNQMFQYAAGRCLAHLNNTQLKLDVTGFSDYKLRNFDLNALHTDCQFASIDEIASLLPSHNLEKALQYLSPKKKRTYYREKYFHFDDNMLRFGKNVYLKGYFQSEKYFLPIKRIIQNEFRIKDEAIVRVKDLFKAKGSANKVSVHIRRGDMKNDPVTAERHGVMPLSYYQKGIEIIRSKVSSPHFYFFSDDIDWAKENFSSADATFVSGEISKTHFEDLYLMSQCDHNIIANSSFSWWGAWLNKNIDKVVIAPNKWFNNGPTDLQDLLPLDWIKI